MRKVFFPVVTVLLLSCGNNNTAKKVPVDTDNVQPDPLVKCEFVAGNELDTSKFVYTTKQSMTLDDRRIVLKVKKYTSTSYPQLRKASDSALHIASVLLSSKDFQEAISKLDFTCRNYYKYCKEQCSGNCNKRFPGTVVLDSAYRQRSASIELFLNKCNHEYGRAAKNVFKITIIKNDAPELPFSYCYAYHIAHEYMHIVGYFHTDHKDDVAHQVGWIGYYILSRWFREGRNPIDVALE